jgi:hypothetical protein
LERPSVSERLTIFVNRRRRWALALTLLLAAFTNFYELQRNGFANLYYAAAVHGMLESWHNFFFVSFDPDGFVTVDKPPLGFWIQAASAKLLGYSGFSILLPEAQAGIAAVALSSDETGGQVFRPFARVMPRLMRRQWALLPALATILGVLVLLIGPAAWVGVSLASGSNGTLPKAGPTATTPLASEALGGSGAGFAGGTQPPNSLGGTPASGGFGGTPAGSVGAGPAGSTRSNTARWFV